MNSNVCITMPKLYPGYRDEIRKKIVIEAFDVFMAKGFEKTTMDEIATRLGVTKPAIYRYFKNKDELFIASVAETMAAEFEKTFTRAFQTGDLMTGAGIFFDELLAFDRKYAGLAKDIESITSRDESLMEGMAGLHSEGIDLMRHFFLEHRRLGIICPIMSDADLTIICSALANGLINSVGHGLDPAEAKRLWLAGFAKLADLSTGTGKGKS